MKLLYFAWVRQKVGRAEEEFSPPAGVTTVAALMETLRARGAGYDEAFREPARVRCAVNQEHVGYDAPLQANDEVAFFPPVTGG